MKAQRIELMIRNIKKEDFLGLLIDFFCNDHSPNFPIRVYCDWITESRKPFKVVLDQSSFRIAIAPEDYLLEASRTLARIIHQEYSSRLVVFIEEEVNEGNEWDKVIGITKSIITKIQQFDGEIISTVPVELMPANLVSDKTIAKKRVGLGEHKPDDSHTKKFDKLREEWGKLKEETKKNYRTANFHIEQLENNILESYKNGDTTILKVNDEELIIYIKEQMGWTISDRTLRRIKEFADVITYEDTDNL